MFSSHLIPKPSEEMGREGALRITGSIANTLTQSQGLCGEKVIFTPQCKNLQSARRICQLLSGLTTIWGFFQMFLYTAHT